MKLIIDIPDEAYELLKNKSELDNIAESIIANGTPVSNKGDLISRSELKKYLEHNSYKYPNDEEFGCGFNECLLQVFMAIDNAPTVNDCSNCEYKKTYDYISSSSSYKELQALRKFKKDNERPQGEWENDSDNLPICNKCGEIALQRIFVKMPHLIQDVRMVRSNYCPNCGADMRKGGAE